MKLLVLSDLHIDFGTFTTPKFDAETVVVLAGDIKSPAGDAVRWAKRSSVFGNAQAVIFVPGNHEYYGCVMQHEFDEMRRAAAGSNVHVLDGDEVVIDGVRFLGCTLWTDFMLPLELKPGVLASNFRLALFEAERFSADFRAIRFRDDGAERRLKPIDSFRIHRRQKFWLRRKFDEPFSGKTVVITHHAPHRGSLHDKYKQDWLSPAFVNDMPQSMFEIPILWIHGHTHDSHDYQVEKCRVICNPRGYELYEGQNENINFNSAMTIELTDKLDQK